MNSPSKSAQKNSGITCSYAFSLYLLQPVSTSISPSVFGEHSQFHNELEGEYLNRSRACSPHRGKQTCMHEQNVHTVHVCYMCKSNRCAQSGFNRRETFKSISVSVSLCGREKLGCRGNNFALVLTLFQWGSKYFCATINYLSVSDSLFLSLLLSCSHTHTPQWRNPLQLNLAWMLCTLLTHILLCLWNMDEFFSWKMAMHGKSVRKSRKQWEGGLKM